MRRASENLTAVTTPDVPSNEDEQFHNPKQSMLASFNYKCPVVRESSSVTLKRRKLLSQKQYRERVKHQIQDSMRQRRLSRISAKKTDQHIDLN